MSSAGILEPGTRLGWAVKGIDFGRLAIACVMFGSLTSEAAAQAAPGAIRNHFDADAAMRAPAFFDFVVLGAPGDADWKVTPDFNPPSAPNDVSQTIPDRPDNSIAAALRRNVSLSDGRISVYLKKLKGRAGMVFRLVSERDFLVLLLDLDRGEAKLVSYREGKPTVLGSGKATFTTLWSMLAVELHGAEIRASWAGKPLLSASDPAPAAGRVGMATAGPGPVTFDEFLIEPAGEKPKP